MTDQAPVFLDFEASSLRKNGYPIEVAWVFADGGSETHLIRPAPDWTDWDDEAEAIHNIDRDTLSWDGTPHGVVGHRMVEVLTGLDLFASAPSWDGKWLSVLLRAAGLSRHALRLRDSDEALDTVAREVLAPWVEGEHLDREVRQILTLADVRDDETPAHRALLDAESERDRWLAVREATKAAAADLRSAVGPA